MHRFFLVQTQIFLKAVFKCKIFFLCSNHILPACFQLDGHLLHFQAAPRGSLVIICNVPSWGNRRHAQVVGNATVAHERLIRRLFIRASKRKCAPQQHERTWELLRNHIFISVIKKKKKGIPSQDISFGGRETVKE